MAETATVLAKPHETSLQEAAREPDLADLDEALIERHPGASILEARLEWKGCCFRCSSKRPSMCRRDEVCETSHSKHRTRV